VAISGAHNESGVFELNLRDERYLPFEGAGAVSRWRIDLPRSSNRFDFGTISDVVIHLRYTARDGAPAALQGPTPDRRPLTRLLSARRDFAAEWHAFRHADPPVLTLRDPRARLPFVHPGETATIEEARVFVQWKHTAPATLRAGMCVRLEPAATTYRRPKDDPNMDILCVVFGAGVPLEGEWRLQPAAARAGAPSGDLQPDDVDIWTPQQVAELEDLCILAQYTIA
jgi:hypothetical protein